MTDAPAQARHRRPRSTSPGAVLVALCLAWSAASAQTVPPVTASRARATGLSPAALPSKPPPKTARQFTEQLVGILQAQKTPWQGYTTYLGIVQEYAAREAAVKTGSARSDAAHARAAEQLRQMAVLLGQMAEQTKIRDEIRRGASAVPFARRQTTFAQAGTEHQRLLAEFTRLAAALPEGGSTLRR